MSVKSEEKNIVNLTTVSCIACWCYYLSHNTYCYETLPGCLCVCVVAVKWPLIPSVCL